MLSRSILALVSIAAPSLGSPIALELVATGIPRPVAIRHAGDGSERLFVLEQFGRVWVIVDGTVLPVPLVDFSSEVVCCNERGALGLEFHPDFETNGYFYLNYTEAELDPPTPCPPGGDCDLNTAIVRYQISKDPNVADPRSATRILTINQPTIGHNGGDIHFGPDGYLYIGMGDGGPALDPENRAQDVNSLHGGLLRIDVDTAPGPSELCGEDAAYGIPPDNPFVGIAGCDEIWSLGLRNPWRWNFDRKTGDLFIGDVGQNQVEEIDFQPATSNGGENYGWSCLEGDRETGFNDCIPGPLTAPVLTYTHGPGCAVIGGYRYRGTAIPELYGGYLYADLCTGTISIATEDGGLWSVADELADSAAISISSFGEDESGELYVADRIGFAVYRIVSSGLIFSDGFESGDLLSWSGSVNPASGRAKFNPSLDSRASRDRHFRRVGHRGSIR